MASYKLSEDITREGGLLDIAIQEAADLPTPTQESLAAHGGIDIKDPSFKADFIAMFEKRDEMASQGRIGEWKDGVISSVKESAGEQIVEKSAPGFSDYVAVARASSQTFAENFPMEKTIPTDKNEQTGQIDRLYHEDYYKDLENFKYGDAKQESDPVATRDAVQTPDTVTDAEKQDMLNEILAESSDIDKQRIEDISQMIKADVEKEGKSISDIDAKLIAVAVNNTVEMKDVAGLSKEDFEKYVNEYFETGKVDVEKEQAAPIHNVEMPQEPERTAQVERPEPTGERTEASTVKYGVEGKIDDKVMLSNVDRIYEHMASRFSKDEKPKDDIEKKMGHAELVARDERWKSSASDILKNSKLSNEQKYEKLAVAYKENFVDTEKHISPNQELFRGVWNRLDKMGQNPSTAAIKDFKSYMEKPEVRSAFEDAIKENTKDSDVDKKVSSFYESLDKAAETSSDKAKDVVNNIRVDYDAMTKKTDGDIEKRPMSDVDPVRAHYLEEAEKAEKNKDALSHGYRRNTFKAVYHYKEVLYKFKAASGDEKKALLGELIGAAFEIYQSDIINTLIFSLFEGIGSWIIDKTEKADDIAGRKDCIDIIDKVSKASSQDAKDVEKPEKDSAAEVSKDDNDSDGKVDNSENDSDNRVSNDEPKEGKEGKIDANEQRENAADSQKPDSATAPDSKDGKAEGAAEKPQEAKAETKGVSTEEAANAKTEGLSDKDSLKAKLTQEIKEQFNDYANKVESSKEAGADVPDTKGVQTEVTRISTDDKYSQLSDTEKSECAKEALDGVENVSADAKETLESIYDKDTGENPVTTDEHQPDQVESNPEESEAGGVEAQEPTEQVETTGAEPVDVNEGTPQDTPVTVAEQAEDNPPTVNEQDNATTPESPEGKVTAEPEPSQHVEAKSDDKGTTPEAEAAAMSEADTGDKAVDQHSAQDMESVQANMEDKIKGFLEDHGPMGENKMESSEVAREISEMANGFGENATDMVTNAFNNAVNDYANEFGEGAMTQEDVGALKTELGDLYQGSTGDSSFEIETGPNDSFDDDDFDKYDFSEFDNVEFDMEGEPFSAGANGLSGLEAPTSDYQFRLDEVADKVMNGDSGMINMVEADVDDVAKREEPSFDNVETGTQNVETPQDQHDYSTNDGNDRVTADTPETPVDTSSAADTIDYSAGVDGAEAAAGAEALL